MGDPINIEFPVGFEFLFQPARYKVAHGGRGAAKSWAFARALIALATQQPLRVLCCRELMNSINESVHRLLADQIENMGLGRYFEVQQSGIFGNNGSQFFFSGIKTNPSKIKSMEKIDRAWVEEAERVSERSWEILIPTVRAPGSEIWASFNVDLESDPCYQRFVANAPPNSVSREFLWYSNGWFPPELREEKNYLYKVDRDAAETVWAGRPRQNSVAQIFRDKYTVEEFLPPKPGDCDPCEMWDGPYHGMDHGFANDPAVFTRLWIDSKHHRLMIEYEAWAIGCELDDLPQLARHIPNIERYVIRADPSRPETISHVARKGQFRVQAAEAWKGSVEDGIAFLRSFEQIVVHPRCRHWLEELRLYSYKIDRLTGDILPEIVDKNNHCIDAGRYALEPLIRNLTTLGIWRRL